MKIVQSLFRFSYLMSAELLNSSLPAAFSLFQTFYAVPFVAVVGFWLLGEAHAREMKPFILATFVVASNHVSVGDVVAEAVGLFHLTRPNC